MIFNEHVELKGRHAFLSASTYHWINYTEEKLVDRYRNHQAARLGTELHELAHNLIRLKVKLPRNSKTLNSYVNDAISWQMKSEQVLYYSHNAFGTADCIGFNKGVLRIHDLKTGVIPASEHQLEVYAALFCLEYGYKPFELEIELRIYQNDEVQEYIADGNDITHIMDKIVTFNKRILEIQLEEGL